MQLHPNASTIYRHKVADLECALNSPKIRAEAGDARRALIERVWCSYQTRWHQMGCASNSMVISLEILRLGEDQQARRGWRDDVAYQAKRPGTGVLDKSNSSVVAGARNHVR